MGLESEEEGSGIGTYWRKGRGGGDSGAVVAEVMRMRIVGREGCMVVWWGGLDRFWSYEEMSDRNRDDRRVLFF